MGDTKGITLIALVITIIVLLILAGVTIATLTGQNGILTQATNAKEENKIGEEKDAIGVAYSACQIDNYGGTVSAEQLENELKKNGYNVRVTTDGTNLVVTFLDSNRSYTISQEGIIKKNEKEEGIIEAQRINNKYFYTKDANGTVKVYPFIAETEIREINQEEGIEITKSGIKQIEYDMLFIDNDGKVYTFGNRLGNGTNDKSDIPICISDIPENPLYNKKITSCNNRILIDENGNIYAWGEICGDGTAENRLLPICLNEVEGSPLANKKITKSFRVEDVNFVRDTQGSIYAWGNSGHYRLLGDGSKDQDVVMPICISTIENSVLQGKNIVDIEGYYYDKVTATDNQGNVYQWGERGSSNALPIEYIDEEITYFKNKKIIQKGGNIALDQEGRIHTWGSNEYGLLGDGSSLETNKTTPVCISNIEGNSLKGQKIVEFVHPYDGIIARSDQGKIYVWGNNKSGKLGVKNATTIINKPICLNDISDSLLQGKNIIQIKNMYTNGMHKILAEDNQGNWYQWGSGSEEIICLNKTEGSDLQGKNVLEIMDAGYETLAARDDQGDVYVWGGWHYDTSSYGDYSIEKTDVPVCLTNKTSNLLYQKKVKKIFTDYEIRIYYTEDGKLLYNTWIEAEV